MTSKAFISTLFLGICVLFTFATSSEISNNIPAYCITFTSDNSYKTSLIHKAKGIEISQSSSQITFNNFPRNLIDSSLESNVYHLENAKEILPKFYGKIFRGSQSESDCNGHKVKRKEKELDVLLVGPCVKSMPVAHYCLIEGKQPILHRTETFENIPKVTLFETSDGNQYSDIYCSGTAKMENITAWDFTEIGKFKLGHFVEEDTCHGQSYWRRNNTAILPEYIDLSADTAFSVTTPQLKQLYGKNIPITWDLSMECNFDKVNKHIEYEILITGKCPSKTKFNKKKQPAIEPWSNSELKIHGKNYDYYTNKNWQKFCIERKVIK